MSTSRRFRVRLLPLRYSIPQCIGRAAEYKVSSFWGGDVNVRVYAGTLPVEQGLLEAAQKIDQIRKG